MSQGNGVDFEYIFLNKSGSFKRKSFKKSSLTSIVSTAVLLINVVSIMPERMQGRPGDNHKYMISYRNLPVPFFFSFCGSHLTHLKCF